MQLSQPCLSPAAPLQATPLLTKVTADSPAFNTVMRVFQDKIASLYGDQAHALEKIRKGLDRTCMLLSVPSGSELDPLKEVGVIVFKNHPTQEFVEYGTAPEGSLEIKTLIVINAEENSGKGYGSILLSAVEEQARRVNAEGIHVTVSAEKPEALNFFQKKQFKEIHRFDGKYKPNCVELLLYKKLSLPK